MKSLNKFLTCKKVYKQYVLDMGIEPGTSGLDISGTDLWTTVLSLQYILLFII